MTTLFVTGGSGFIGSNLIPYFVELGWQVANFDIVPPLDSRQAAYWIDGSILKRDALVEAVGSAAPDFVLHLAGRTDCDERTTVEAGYSANTEGTRNVLAALRRTSSVKRFVLTSSQFVCGPGYIPRGDRDYAPATVYGQSKAIAEEFTRDAGLDCTWTIVRPTNIWGPWHLRYASEFWRVAENGLYFHPGGKPVIRCYGYVGNIVHWLEEIFAAEHEKVASTTFYLSDPASDIYRWANAFCEGLCGRSARRVPRRVLAGLGVAGDLISAVRRRPFYISSSRYRSMTSNYQAPPTLERTYELLGHPRFSLEQGVDATIQWLKRWRGGSMSHASATGPELGHEGGARAVLDTSRSASREP